LNKQGYFNKKPVKKPLLLPRHLRARLEFCKDHESWTSNDWRSVIFSDESKIQLVNNSYGYVWRKANEKLHPDCVAPTVKFGGGGINVWGSISFRGGGNLAIINGNLNAVGYKKILIDYLLPTYPGLSDASEIFMHDNDPKHQSKEVKKFSFKQKHWCFGMAIE